MPTVTLFADHLWRGQLYPQGDRDVPDDLAIALGLQLRQPTATNTDTDVNHPPALQLLNSATDPSALTPLPGVGMGAAKRILLHRPALGYSSFEQFEALCPELTKSPYRCDFEAIAAWHPDSGASEL